MTPDRRYTLLLGRLAGALPLVALGLGGWVVYRARTLPVPDTGMLVARAGLSVVPATLLPDSLDWSVFQNEQAPTPAVRGALSRRFRLAGTFFAYGSEAGESRRAVLHDLQSSVQMIVGEGESIGDVTIVHIASDRVILRRGLEEAELWLGFSRSDAERSAVAGDTEKPGAGKEDAFGGRKTGEQCWVFRREALQEYYQAVLDDPERLVRIFDSMKAVRGGDRRISGYRLDILGEGEFYRAAGMQQGDIVRKVNGMNMTSRRRAEFFIGEFARNRANVFEIEIERNGAPLKLTYQIR